jgi:hypothetical protein
MASLAKEYGFIYQQLWEHAKNADLKELRGNPNILLAGDVVHIPDLTTKTENGATEQRHRYRRKGIPSKLRLQLMEGGEPRSGLDFEITFDDGSVVAGITDAEGYVAVSVQPERKWGSVVVQGGWGPEVYKVVLGDLDPIDELTGVQQRLKNLGRKCEPTGELDEQTCKALRRFQKQHGLDETGEPDAALRSKLTEVCGS